MVKANVIPGKFLSCLKKFYTCIKSSDWRFGASFFILGGGITQRRKGNESCS